MKKNFFTNNLNIFLFQIFSIFLIIFFDSSLITSKTILFLFFLILLIYFCNTIIVKILKGDNYLLSIVSMLFSIGIVIIYRIDSSLGNKQIIWLCISLVAFFFTYIFMHKMSFFKNRTSLLFLICSVLFVITIIFGTTINGAKNWIIIAGHSFQLSEITKIIFIIYLASFYSKPDVYKEFKYGKYFAFISTYLFIMMFFIQKDLGNALIFWGIFFIISFVFSNNLYLIYLNIFLISFGGLIGYFIFDHVKIRMLTWIDPWKYIDTTGYQITQSLFAIANGGFWGTGIGLGNPEYIPLSYSDFIFASIIEEFGSFFGIGIIILFMILTYRGLKIALTTKDMFYKIISVGISSMFAIQSIIMFAGVMKIIPLTGLTIPFISYGGSSMVSSFISVAILQYISSNKNYGVNKDGVNNG